VPEQPAISITVTISPQVASGLHALVQKTFAEAAAQAPPKDSRKARPNIDNSNTGTVRGTLLQIGYVEGDFHNHGNR
jgi:hypothetical protein